MSNHWTEQDFLNRLYEVGPDDGHLHHCAECRARWDELANQRRQMLRTPDVPAELLAAQRMRIGARVEERTRGRMFWRWSPAIAMAGLTLFAVLWTRPTPTEPTKSETATIAGARSDAQLMTDIYRSVYETEPGAVESMRGLFEGRR